MSQKIIPGSQQIAQQIRHRRKELGLTIEEAASRAGVGIKTWCRYEAGESIRKEKSKGICKALNWHSFPGQEGQENGKTIDEFRTLKSWSEYLENNYGLGAALSFAAGSEILRAHLEEDMRALSSMPRGSHLGQLNISLLRDSLPEQFLLHYDYDFLYLMKCALLEMTERASAGEAMTAHSVLQELILYLCGSEAAVYIELNDYSGLSEDAEGKEPVDWVFNLFGDRDLVSFLYAGQYLQPHHPYHFSRWDDLQFFMPSDEPKSNLASLFD